MASILRIIVGIGVLIGTLVTRIRAKPTDQIGDEIITTLTLGGVELAASTVNLILLAFTLIGLGMILTGVLGIARRKS